MGFFVSDFGVGVFLCYLDFNLFIVGYPPPRKINKWTLVSKAPVIYVLSLIKLR